MVKIIPVLFVDDNRELSNIFQFYLEETGLFSVHVCLDGLDALDYLRHHQVKVVISDYDMPDMDGITLLRQIKSEHPRLPFIMLTGNDSKEIAIEALNSGADFYQNKAEDLEIQVLDLSHKLTILVERAEAEAALERKDIILEVISRAAGRLLQGGDFHAEMQQTLHDIARVMDAKGIFIGDMDKISDLSTPERLDAILWWKNDEALSQTPPEKDRLALASLLSLMRQEKPRNNVIFWSRETATPEVNTIFHETGITIALLIPVIAGDENWGFFGLVAERPGGSFSDPEMHALRMTAEIAGAARYRAYMEEYFKNPVEKSLVGVFLIRNNRFLYINPRFSSIFGYSRAELIRSRSFPGLLGPEEGGKIQTLFDSILAGEQNSEHLEIVAHHRNGTEIFLELYVTIFRGNNTSCLIGNCMDITARKKAETQVREGEELLRKNMMISLREKETLLREIHHRVKNNIQIISSLLRLSDLQSGNPEVHEIIRDCRNRISSMAAIHEKLYETDDLAAVPLGDYIRDVGNRIITEFEMEEGQVVFEVREETPVLVDIGTGIPIGLIMNELITNSIKHAFPDGKKGRIGISIILQNNVCTIRYSDNGRGLPPGIETQETNSLGLELIKNLSTQIRGTVSFESGVGMVSRISFPLPDRSHPHTTTDENQ